jgi:Dyp-type peroxidase family
MDVRTGDKGMQVGRIRAITTLSRVIASRRSRLERRLATVRYLPGAGRPLQDLAFIHFAHWSVLGRLPPPESGRSPVSLRSMHLLFESNYDGLSADYLDAFADRLPLRIENIWSCCEGFDERVLTGRLADGRRFPPRAFKDYVAGDQLSVVHFYAAYPDATTRTLRQAVRLQTGGRANAPAVQSALALAPDPPAGVRLEGPLDGLRAWRRTAFKRFYETPPLLIATPLDPATDLDAMEASLRELSGDHSPLREVPGTHFARLVVIPAGLELRDGGQLPCPYLLFTAIHDDGEEQYLAQLAGLAADARAALWGGCPELPDRSDAFARWLAQHKLAEPRYFVAGVHPARSAAAFEDALRDRRALARRLTTGGGTGASSEPALADVQGNVLHAYGVGFPAAAHRLLRIVDGRAADARAVLESWSRLVTFDREPPRLQDTRRGRAHLNLAFTYDGLVGLGADGRELAELPEDFRQGAAERAPGLGDRAESAVGDWEFGHPPAHVLVSVHGSSPDAARSALERLLDELGRAGGEPLVTVHPQETALLCRPGHLPPERTCGDVYAREHFGFADGCSQPGIESVHAPEELAVPGAGVHATRPPASLVGGLLEAWKLRPPRRGWRGVALGEFVLGHPDEDGSPAPGSRSALAWGGTFMVYRKLAQDVEGFLDHTARAGPRALDNDEVRARIIGRWADGTPLARSPHGPDPQLAADRRAANEFGYADDPLGLACPLGAHIRRTNPRDGLPAGGEATMRHRIIRRGMPYGPPYSDGKAGEEPYPPPRGLLFICFSSSIQRGFETIQSAWCDDGGVLGLESTPDYLLQQRPADGQRPRGELVLDPARGLTIGPPPRPFVITRGMEYLLVPGRAGLRRLVER